MSDKPDDKAPPKSSGTVNPRSLRPQFEDRVLFGFVVVSTLAMALISWPFFGAILWALVAAITFMPLHDRLKRRFPKRRNSIAAFTLLLVIMIVILPAALIGTMLVDEAVSTYAYFQANPINFFQISQDIQRSIPSEWVQYFDRFAPKDMGAIQSRISGFVTNALQLLAGQAVAVGQSALGFAMALGVMLYLTFFLLRDGRDLSRVIGGAVPMRQDQRHALFSKFTTVVRATVKGSIVVAIIQGTLGGIIFAILDIRAALLWGVVMGVLSLVPAVGAGLIWLPVAIFLLITGWVWQGIVLILFGVLVIGMVDNVLRPILVGQDTRMPDYVVLISTLGGISVMGFNGFIIGPVIAAMFIAAWQIFSESRTPERL
jgi:predicted PurR-regulated permease PerM